MLLDGYRWTHIRLEERKELDHIETRADLSAEKIKEDYTYVCQDIVKEFKKYDSDPYKYFARFAGEHSVTGRVSGSPILNLLPALLLPKITQPDTDNQKYDLDIGYERFLAPEIFFNPEIYSSDFLTPLPEVVDTVIQTSPIDVRRGLYKNIVLSGGSTMFKDFGKRLQRDVKAIVDGRIAGSEQKSGSLMKVRSAIPCSRCGTELITVERSRGQCHFAQATEVCGLVRRFSYGLYCEFSIAYYGRLQS